MATIVLNGVPIKFVFFDWSGTLALKKNAAQKNDKKVQSTYNLVSALPVEHRQRLEGQVLDLAAEIEEESGFFKHHPRAHIPSQPALQHLPIDHHTYVGEPAVVVEDCTHVEHAHTTDWAMTPLLVKVLATHGVPPDVARAAAQRYTALNDVLAPGSRELVEWLRAREVPMSLIRNAKASKDAMFSRLEHLNFKHYFKSLTLSGEAGVSKPHPKIFQTALQHADAEHFDPSQIAFIANETIADVTGGNRMGWRTVLVRHTEASSDGQAFLEVDTGHAHRPACHAAKRKPVTLQHP
eukprot:CAMPEP_0177653518 /NCGR_PEP_ID=MMETSP0447-20121125/13779_1 /TAXON_ID=0 /ORGANISM="Stygamoeba regulata, Strain BSH-02190019" /LENGTH=294 /DNA_ID=CAMNT_0019156981 /DNA_START=52 /DNA_END=932 /DNA_ORIENTATION=+